MNKEIIRLRPALRISRGVEDERMLQLLEMDRHLSGEAVRFLPQQVVLTAAFAGLMMEGTSAPPACWTVLAIVTLGLSFCFTALAASRVLSRPTWSAENPQELLEASARMVAHKGLAIRCGAWVLLAAAVCVAVVASVTLT